MTVDEQPVDDAVNRWPADVERAIMAVIASTAAAMLPAGDSGRELSQAIVRAGEGGKRLRSSILLASHGANGGGAEHAVLTLGAAMELFHTAALLHDDVLDDSDTRRGRPSVHRAFASMHHDRALTGDPLAYGRAGAILAGDVAMLASGRALRAAIGLLPASSADTVATLFQDTLDLVTAGQFLDMNLAARPIDAIPGDEETIRAVMRSKTASYTWEAPLALGAAAAGADVTIVSRLRAVGLLAGIAFQLRDDILGLTGAPAVTGKPVGDDIREGKRTLLVWHTWTTANTAQRVELKRALGNRDASDSEVANAINVVRDVGAFEAVEDEIARTTDVVRERLAGLPLAEPYRAYLDGLVESATHRDR